MGDSGRHEKPIPIPFWGKPKVSYKFASSDDKTYFNEGRLRKEDYNSPNLKLCKLRWIILIKNLIKLGTTF